MDFKTPRDITQSQITDRLSVSLSYPDINLYLVSPPEEARCVDVWVGVIFVVRHLNVVPHAVVYSGHDRKKSQGR